MLVPGARYAAPSIEVPYDASFADASLDVAPRGGSVSPNADETVADFGQGTVLRGFSNGPQGLDLLPLSTYQVDSFAVAGALALDGLVKVSGGLMLAPGRQNGSVTVQGGNFTRGALAMFSPGGLTPDGTSFSFDLIDSSNATVQAGIAPGAVVDLTGTPLNLSGYRAHLVTAFLHRSPFLVNVSVGTALGETFVNNSIARSAPANIRPDGSPLRAPPNATSLVRLSLNPVMPQGSNDAWSSGDHFTTAMIRVGREYWAYFLSSNSTATYIGRAVSLDLLTWSVDPGPSLAPGPETYDSGGLLGVTSVVFDANKARFNMYYGCGGYYSNPDSCLATSPDGVNWTKFTGNPVVQTVASTWYQFRAFQPMMVVAGTSYKLYVQGQADDFSSNVGLWTSSDGENFSASAGNPIFPRSGSGADADIDWGTMVYNGTKYVFFYSCTDGSYAWDICLAESSDGVTSWTRRGVVLAHDLTGFDAWDTGWPAVVWDENRFLFVYGGIPCDPVPAPCTPTRRLGAGASTFLAGTHTFNGRFDFGAARPVAFGAFRANATVPGGASVSYALRSSDDLLSWSAYEPITTGSTPSATPVARFVEYRVQLAAASPTSSPSVHSLRLEFSSQPRAGGFESRLIPFGGPALNFTALATTTGAVANATWSWRPNLTAAWQPLVLGVPVPAAPAQTALQYRILVVPYADQLFAVTRVGVTPRDVGTPLDLHLEFGPPASPIVVGVPGFLTQNTRVTVPPELLNGVLALLRGQSAPGMSLRVEIGARSAASASLFVGNFSANLTLPDNQPPALFAFPSRFALNASKGEVGQFEIGFADPEGDAVDIEWLVNGSTAAPGPKFSVAFDSSGDWTVEARVTSAGFAARFAWTVRVVEPAPPPLVLTVLVLPQPGPLNATVGARGLFTAQANASAGPAPLLSWFLNGTLVLAGSSFDLLYSAEGLWAIRVTASAGSELRTFEWTVSVRNLPPPPPPVNATDHPPAIYVLPADGELRRALGDALTLSIIAFDADGDPFAFVWRLNGTSAGSTANFSATLDAPGVWHVEGAVSGGGANRSYTWTIQVVEPSPVVSTTNQVGSGLELLYSILGLAAGLAAGLFVAMWRRKKPEA